MSEVSTRLQVSSSLLHALDVITNPRAFLSFVLGFSLVVVLAVFFTYVDARLLFSGRDNMAGFLGLIGVVINLVIALGTYSTAGVHVHRQLSGMPPLPLGTGFLAGFATLPRLVGLVVLCILGVMVVMFVLLVVYLVCKIPVLGHVLYFVALPAGTLIIGILALATAFLVPLFGPAAWAGHSVLRSMAIFWGILRQRLLTVVVNSLLLGLLVGLIFMLLLSAYLEGMFVNMSLSSITLGSSVQGILGGLSMLFMGGGDGMGYLYAGSLGMLLLAVALGAVPVMVLIAGHCLIFRTAAEGLEVQALESSLRDRVADTQRQVQEAVQQVREKAAAATEQAALPAPAGEKCPRCGTPLEGDEVFCGNCGRRIDA